MGNYGMGMLCRFRGLTDSRVGEPNGIQEFGMLYCLHAAFRNGMEDHLWGGMITHAHTHT